MRNNILKWLSLGTFVCLMLTAPLRVYAEEEIREPIFEDEEEQLYTTDEVFDLTEEPDEITEETTEDFSGIFSEDVIEFTEDVIDIPEESILYGAESYVTVKWDGGEGLVWDYDIEEFVQYIEEDYMEGETISIYLGPETQAPANKAFVGWSVDGTEAGIVSNGDYLVSGNVTFTAIWADGVKVLWNAGEWGKIAIWHGEPDPEDESSWGYTTYETSLEETVAKGYRIPTFPAVETTAEGKAFLGWSTTIDETGLIPWVLTRAGDVVYRYLVNDDVTITAIWKDKVTVTWDAGEGSFYTYYFGEKQSYKTVDQEYASGASLEPYRQHILKNIEHPTGKTFIGWSTDGTKAGLIEQNECFEEDNYCFTYDNKYPVVENMTLTAIWEDGSSSDHIHKYENWKVTTPATCVNTGIETGTCECGETGTRDIPALGHSFSAWETSKASTEEAEGEMIRTCKRCGKKETKVIPKTEVKITIPKKPSIKKPTATKNKITVKWTHFKHTSKKMKKIWTGIKKVQIQCATDKDFTNVIKTSTVNKSKTKASIKGLQKNATYYLRVRYSDGSGYSNWSSVKKIKTKK